MNLDRKSWHVRFFFWSLEVVDAFLKGGYPTYEFQDRTNLCHFMRVLLVYLPFILSVHAALIVSAVYALGFLPYSFFGIPYLRLAGYVLAVIAFIGFAAFGAVRVLQMMKEKAEQAATAAEKKEVERKPERPKRKRQGPGFSEVVGAWLKARKQQICPEIRFCATEEVRHV